MMERDFMGLTVKQETPDDTKDSEVVPTKVPPVLLINYNAPGVAWLATRRASIGGSTMQWSIQNKVSGPQFLSFKGAQEDKPKTGFESLASTGLVTITTTESYDSVQKTYLGVMQKNMVLGKQGGIPYTLTTYPAQHFDAHSVHRPEIRVHPVTSQMNQTVSLAPLHQSIFCPAGQNLIGPSSAQNLGEVSKTGTVPAIPAGTCVVGTTDLWNGSKTAVTSAQMTIFYNGSVCVYDDISPEKAQAILLLAGNGPPSTSSATPPAAPIQAPVLRSSVVGGLLINRSHSMTPCISSPIHVSSRCGSQSAGGSDSCTNMTSLKSNGGITSPCSTAESSKVVNILGSSPDPLKTSAVPQARKASLARFLERRKGRIIGTSPYAKNESSDARATASGNTSFAMNSSSSSPVRATS